MTAGLDDELRTVVRDVLRELLPSIGALAAGDGAAPSAAPAPSAVPAPARPVHAVPPLSVPPLDAAPLDAAPLGVTAPPQRSDAARPTGATAPAGTDDADVVVLRSDADLDAFVRKLLTLFDNPVHRADLRAGRRRFRLAAAPAAGEAGPVHRLDKGAVTEAHVRKAAAAGARLVLGRRAVLTPLARDRARALGVHVEKER